MLEQSAVADCTKNLDESTKKRLIILLEELEQDFAADDINHIIATSAKLYETIFTTAKHHIAWEVVQRLNGRISRLRIVTMKSTQREISGFQRIKNICEAIYLHQDPERAKQAVAEHIAEAASVAKNILNQN